MNQDPYAANPFGSPYQANPASYQGFPQAAMQFSNLFMGNGMTQGQYSTAQRGGLGNLDRRIRSDFDRRIESASKRESVYGAGSDPRINNAISYMEDLGLTDKGASQDMAIEDEFERIKNHKDAGKRGNVAFSSGGKNFLFEQKKGQYRETDDDGEFINSESEDEQIFRSRQRKNQRRRINAGNFVNTTEVGQKMFGQNFGDSGALHDAAGALTDELMTSGNGPTFGNLNDEAKSRGALTRDMTNALMEGMQLKDKDGKSTGRFDTNSFGSSEGASSIIKAFARGGALDFSDSMKEMTNAAGQVSTTIDPEALKQMILPKVKAMTDTLGTLAEIYQEADPDKLMRIAAEVTGLNPNDPRNADLVNSQVANMSEVAQQFNTKPAEYMSNVVGVAQELSRGGFSQFQSGQMAQDIMLSSYAESQTQRAFSDVESGGYAQMTPEEIAKRQTALANGILNDNSQAFKQFAGASELRQLVRQGNSPFDEGEEGQQLQKEMMDMLKNGPGSEEEMNDLSNRIQQATGMDIEEIGRDAKASMQRTNSNPQDFIKGIMQSRNETLIEGVMDQYNFSGLRGKGDLKVDEEGNPVYEEVGDDQTQKMRAQIKDADEQDEKSAVKRLQTKLVEDGKLGQDGEGNLVFSDDETEKAYKEAIDDFKSENLRLDDDGNFRDNAVGNQARKKFEEDQFAKDEDGNRIQARDSAAFNPEQREIAKKMLQFSDEDQLRKIMAVAGGNDLDSEGRTIEGPDAITRELNRTLKEIDESDMTKEEKEQARNDAKADSRQDRIIQTAELLNDADFRERTKGLNMAERGLKVDEDKLRERAKGQGVTAKEDQDAIIAQQLKLEADLKKVDESAMSDDEKKEARQNLLNKGKTELETIASAGMAAEIVDSGVFADGKKRGAMNAARANLSAQNGAASTEGGLIQAQEAAKRVQEANKRKDDLSKFFEGNGADSFLAGMAKGKDADALIKAEIEKGTFEEGDLEQGSDMVAERIADARATMDSQAGANLASRDEDATALVNKKLEDDSFRDVVKAGLLSEKLLTGDTEEQQLATADGRIDAVMAKIADPDSGDLDATEQKIADVIGSTAVMDARDRGSASDLGTLTGGTKEARAAAEEMIKLTSAMEALTEMLDGQAEDDATKTVKLAEGTTFTATLTNDLKSLIMNSE